LRTTAHERRPPKKRSIRPLLAVLAGAGSFLMLYDPAWFVGFGLAVAALVLGVPCLKAGHNKIDRLALAGIILAVAGAAVYAVVGFASF